MKAERLAESQAESEIEADERRYVALMPAHETRERLLAQSIKLRRVTRKLTAERARAEKALELAQKMFHEASLNMPMYKWKEWQDEIKELSNGTNA
jgi:hypothetical protein